MKTETHSIHDLKKLRKFCCFLFILFRFLSWKCHGRGDIILCLLKNKIKLRYPLDQAWVLTTLGPHTARQVFYQARLPNLYYSKFVSNKSILQLAKFILQY